MSMQITPVYSTASALERAIAAALYPVCHTPYNRDTWVKLLQPPSEYAFDEAKLLCQESPTTWIAWVPNYGEVLLDHGDFYC